jgi:hypothetical protein
MALWRMICTARMSVGSVIIMHHGKRTIGKGTKMSEEAPLPEVPQVPIIPKEYPKRQKRAPGWRKRLAMSYKNPVEARLPTIRYLGTITLDHVPDGMPGFEGDTTGIYMPVGCCQRCGMLIRWEAEMREGHRRRCR